jgi:hypothetical protein
MENEVKTGELFVSLEKRPKISSCCDYGRESNSLQQKKPDQT